MLKKQAADDLFEQSSMTFGEHLEELRRALAKSFIWWGLGTILGLMLADRIVKFIETPLKAAISEYYVERAKVEFKAANGVEPTAELALWMRKNSMMPQRAFVDPTVVSDMLQFPSAINPEIESLPPEVALLHSAPIELQAASQSKPASQPKPISQAEPASQAEPTSQPKPASQAEPAEPPAVVGHSGPTKSVVERLEHNPWDGVDLKQLNRLQPFILWQPIPNKLVTLTAMEPFMMWLKAGLVAGVILGAPGIFWHVWQFFAAGLYPHERRYVYWYLPLSLALFFAGVALAFFVVFRLILSFLIGYTTSLDVEFTPRLNDYMTFAMFLPLGFGLAFQLPLVMLGLHRFGIVSVETFLSQWRVAVLAISFLAMVLTPADPYSMLGLGLPLVVLYFFGVGLCKYMPKGAGIGAPAIDPR
jgi:sec-independent protein translocase protein TatC